MHTTLTERDSLSPPPTRGRLSDDRRRTARSRRIPISPLIGWGLLGAALVLGIAWPLIMLLISAFRSGSPLTTSHWTLDGFADLPDNLMRDHALTNSIILAVATTVLGVAAALALALLERTNAVARWMIRPLVLVSVGTSAMFYAMGYSQLGNRYTGILNVWAGAAGGQGAVVNIESWYGLILVDSLHASAFVYLFLVGPVARLNATYEEAAAMSGAGRLRTLRTVTAPLLTPILLSTILIGLISGLQSFDAPLILGNPANLSFLGTRIWSLINDQNPPLYAQAGAIAVVMLITLLALAVLQAQLLRRHSSVSVTGKSFRAARWDLGAFRWAAGAAIAVYAVLAVLAPFTSVVLTSFQPFPGVWHNLSTRNYTQLLANPAVSSAVTNTVAIAVIGGLIATTMAIAIATVAKHASPRTGNALRAATLIPLAMPGIVAAIAVTWAYAGVPGLRELYGTIWLMVIAVTVAVLPVTVQIVSGALAQLGSELEESAQMSGAGPLRVLRTVTLPLLLPSLVAGWFISGVLISGNLDAPLILAGHDTQTISTLTYQMFSSQNQGQAAALMTLLVAALLAVGATVLLVSGIARAVRRRRGVADATPLSRVGETS